MLRARGRSPTDAQIARFLAHPKDDLEKGREAVAGSACAVMRIAPQSEAVARRARGGPDT